MPRYYITLPNKEKSIKNYILERLSIYPNITIKNSETPSFFCVEITSEMACVRKIIVSIIASSITLFYKYRVLKNSITVAETVGIEFHALIGALLGVELDDEMRGIEKSLINFTSFDIEGIWNFRINEMIDSWKALASLARKLLENCETEEDVYELTAFLVNLDKSTPPKVRIECEPLEIFVDDVKLTIASLTENANYNLVMNIMRERPLSIIVRDTESLDLEFLDAIRKLGTR